MGSKGLMIMIGKILSVVTVKINHVKDCKIHAYSPLFSNGVLFGSILIQ